ncbi:hypothetical protein [Clostridium sp. ZS2-4]|uniref:hypothetical protein n=1 Tax=Clostridium sp. ZS2-4 TaxID=2987703 RepID=UPI00227AF2E1|nr:hypothetical protein [Clostridium sp. ZS2-4]
MLIPRKNISFKKYGVSTPILLNNNQTLVYESDTFISTMDYSGIISQIIPKSKTLSSFFINKLSKISKGYCSLGGKYSNVNFYSPKAKTLSGSERICYTKYLHNNKLKVMEYYGSRGSKYSGYYSMLISKIKASEKFEFDTKNNTFYVDENNIDIFIDIMNNIMNDIINEDLIALKDKRFDKIIIEGKYYYYNVISWDYAKNYSSIKKSYINPQNLKRDFENVLKYIYSKDELAIDDIRIDVAAAKKDENKFTNLSIKESLDNLSGELEALSTITIELEELLEYSIENIYDDFNYEYLENISQGIEGLRENLVVLDYTIQVKFNNIISVLEDLIKKDALEQLAEFDSEKYTNDFFREQEDRFGFDEDLSSSRMENAASEAYYKGEELYFNAENLLKGLLNNLRQLCK